MFEYGNGSIVQTKILEFPANESYPGSLDDLVSRFETCSWVQSFGVLLATVPESKADCERDVQCATGALALLHKPVVLPSDVDFLSVPALLRHEPFKFDKPSKWGMPGLKGFENKPDGIELFCANAKPGEEYILRCYYEPTNTSLRWFAVKGCKIADLFVGEWYDLIMPDGFAQRRRGKDSRRAPRRIKEVQAPQARACRLRQARVVRRPCLQSYSAGALSVAARVVVVGA